MTRMMAPPSADDMLAAQQMDPTAPPTAGGLFPSSAGSARAPGLPPPSAPSSPPPSTSAPQTPSSPGGFDPYATETTFSTEGSSSSTSQQQQQQTGSSWWPFGSS
eukprot:CAMPEP_0198126712 /NCGR_PEP_ID=MMETSP1442-20131203/45499_1 /TAXON_ID= /ORGANISM="Craspedostauros australis, Strain CCMP3328" /LENGTH=104 /DNA_ID=CAMNT_0043786561 /DNA_START=11 /DNA_END=325 /DNA_ORIENTATION=-